MAYQLLHVVVLTWVIGAGLASWLGHVPNGLWQEFLGGHIEHPLIRSLHEGRLRALTIKRETASCALTVCLETFNEKLYGLSWVGTGYTPVDADACGDLVDTLVTCVKEAMGDPDKAWCSCPYWDVDTSVQALHYRDTFEKENCNMQGEKCEDTGLEECGKLIDASYEAQDKQYTRKRYLAPEVGAALGKAEDCLKNLGREGPAENCPKYNYLLETTPHLSVASIRINMQSCPIYNALDCEHQDLCKDGQIDEEEYQKAEECTTVEQLNGCDNMEGYVEDSRAYMKEKLEQQCKIRQAVDEFKSENGCSSVNADTVNADSKDGNTPAETKLTVSLRNLAEKLKVSKKVTPMKVASPEERINTIVKLLRKAINRE